MEKELKNEVKTEEAKDKLQYLSKQHLENATIKDIVYDLAKLRERRDIQPMTDEQINEVTSELFVSYVEHGGLGLSTTQIDNPFRACLIMVNDPLVLINPKIVKYGWMSDGTPGQRVVYVEGCLSLPKTLDKPKKTMRFTHMTVETDNLGVVEFGPSSSKWQTDLFADKGLLECIVAQHEIDHLNGKLITDKGIHYNKQVAVNKIGRNEKVMVKSPDGDTLSYMKYKHAKPLVEEAGYEIV